MSGFLNYEVFDALLLALGNVLAMCWLSEDPCILQSKTNVVLFISLYGICYKHSWTNVFGLLQGAKVVLQMDACNIFRSSVLCCEAKIETLAKVQARLVQVRTFHHEQKATEMLLGLRMCNENYFPGRALQQDAQWLQSAQNCCWIWITNSTFAILSYQCILKFCFV